MLNGLQSAGMLIQGGIFALGPNSSLNQWTGRDDVSIQLMWQLEGFGIGNLARIKKQRGNESQAIIELRHAQDMVAADVTRALRARPVGGGPGPPGRPRLAYGHHHLQRAPRGPETDQTSGKRPRSDLQTARSRLLAGASERGLQ